MVSSTGETHISSSFNGVGTWQNVGGHIWRAQHRDASRAKVTSQISVGSMPRLNSGSESGGGAQTYLCPHAPLAPPPGSHASVIISLPQYDPGCCWGDKPYQTNKLYQVCFARFTSLTRFALPGSILLPGVHRQFHFPYQACFVRFNAFTRLDS